jgi:hypothetical protein
MGKKFSKDTDSGWLNYHDNDGKYKAPSGPRCHVSHPVIKIGGGELVGASCSNPREGFDVYIGLDGSMNLDDAAYPWAEHRKEHVHYPITDMKAPSDPESFKKMVDWLCNQLQEGKKVHAGCIGGHGRTGTLFAAIAARFGHKDCIAWAREHHCKKAVESQSQIDFLVKHFGALPAKPTKSYTSTAPSTGFLGTSIPSYSSSVGSDGKTRKTFQPAPSKKSIWAA